MPEMQRLGTEVDYADTVALLTSTAWKRAEMVFRDVCEEGCLAPDQPVALEDAVPAILTADARVRAREDRDCARQFAGLWLDHGREADSWLSGDTIILEPETVVRLLTDCHQATEDEAGRHRRATLQYMKRLSDAGFHRGQAVPCTRERMLELLTALETNPQEQFVREAEERCGETTIVLAVQPTIPYRPCFRPELVQWVVAARDQIERWHMSKEVLAKTDDPEDRALAHFQAGNYNPCLDEIGKLNLCERRRTGLYQMKMLSEFHTGRFAEALSTLREYGPLFGEKRLDLAPLDSRSQVEIVLLRQLGMHEQAFGVLRELIEELESLDVSPERGQVYFAGGWRDPHWYAEWVAFAGKEVMDLADAENIASNLLVEARRKVMGLVARLRVLQAAVTD